MNRLRHVRIRGMAVFGDSGHVDRALDEAARRVALLLPKRVRFWSYIQDGVQHMHPNEVVPDVRYMSVLERMPRRRNEAKR